MVEGNYNHRDGLEGSRARGDEQLFNKFHHCCERATTPVLHSSNIALSSEWCVAGTSCIANTKKKLNLFSKLSFLLYCNNFNNRVFDRKLLTIVRLFIPY